MEDQRIKDTMDRHLPKLAATAKLYPSLLESRGRKERFTKEEVDALPDESIRSLIWKSSKRPE